MNKSNTNEKVQKSGVFITWIVLVALLLSACAGAQKAKTYRVGVLSGMGAFADAVDGFKSKMTELGYVEGKNISYDVQSTTEIDTEAYKRITQKFVADKVDLIFVFPTEATVVAKAATQGTNISLVFTGTYTDIPGVNIVNSIAEPGGNITGARVAGQEDASKRLEILLEIAPNAKRIFVPYFKGYPNVPMMLDIIGPQAASKGVELIEFGTNDPQELQAKMDSFVTSDGVGIDAILQLGEPLAVTPAFYSILGKFSYDHRIPIGGTMMSIDGKYSSIFGLLLEGKAIGALAAVQADKIFKGTPAGTIPVITPENHLIVNYKAAQDLGVTVPQGVLSEAYQIIR